MQLRVNGKRLSPFPQNNLHHSFAENLVETDEIGGFEL